MSNIEILNIVKGFLLGVLTKFVMPIAPFVFLALFLTIGDTHFGIKAAKKRGEEITREKKMGILDKIIPYLYVLMLLQLVTIIMKMPVNLAYFGCGVITYFEAESIFKHIQFITGTDFNSYLSQFFEKLLPKKK